MRKYQFTFLVMVILSILIVFGGCQLLSPNTADQNLKQLKRGFISNDNTYANDYYEFKVKLPKSWKGAVGDPPQVLVCRPTSREIADGSARRLIDIKILVREVKEKETLDSVIESYKTGNGYEMVLERPGLVKDVESKRCIFYGNLKETPLKINSLFILRENKLVIIQCQAVKPLFDNVEAQFRYCMDSYLVTAKSALPTTPTPMPDPFDREFDFVNYETLEGDTAQSLAKRFMGDDRRAWIIIKTNELDALTPGISIKIPRFVSYKALASDTFESISSKFFSTGSYANLIKQYNDGIDLAPEATIFLPLYEILQPEAGEDYANLAERIYTDALKADFLQAYNNKIPLSELEYVKLPIFMMKKFYTYKVEKGDSLAMIASWLTGDSRNYRAIAEANGITSPYMISLNQELKIPARLISDPDVFNRPKPKPKPRPKPAVDPEGESAEASEEIGDAEAMEEPGEGEAEAVEEGPTPTPLPLPGGDIGIYDLD